MKTFHHSLGYHLLTTNGTVLSLVCAGVILPGIGIASQVIVMYLNVYYIVVLAWALFYLFSSFRSPLPWSICSNTWNTGML